MDKKGFFAKAPSKENSAEVKPVKKSLFANLSNSFLSLLKLVIGILLLPFVYGTTLNFVKELFKLPKDIVSAFIFGGLIFLIIYLFILEPRAIYKKGQVIVELIFKFFSPLMKVASYVVPIYTIIFLVLFWMLQAALKINLTKEAIFLVGFSFCFHIVLTAKILRGKEQDVLKANYIFGFSLVYILNLIMLALFFNFIFTDFSFVEFSNQSYSDAQKVYYLILQQIFGVK